MQILRLTMCSTVEPFCWTNPINHLDFVITFSLVELLLWLNGVLVTMRAEKWNSHCFHSWLKLSRKIFIKKSSECDDIDVFPIDMHFWWTDCSLDHMEEIGRSGVIKADEDWPLNDICDRFFVFIRTFYKHSNSQDLVNTFLLLQFLLF